MRGIIIYIYIKGAKADDYMDILGNISTEKHAFIICG